MAKLYIKDNLFSGTDYTLPTASSSTLGGIKIGENMDIDADGYLTALSSTIILYSEAEYNAIPEADKIKNDYLVLDDSYENGKKLFLKGNELEIPKDIDTSVSLTGKASSISITTNNKLAEVNKLGGLSNKVTVDGTTSLESNPIVDVKSEGGKNILKPTTDKGRTPLAISANTTFVVSCIRTNTSSDLYFVFYEPNGTQHQFGINQSLGNNRYYRVITPTYDVAECVYYDNCDMMVELGNSPTSYVPYVSDSYTIPTESRITNLFCGKWSQANVGAGGELVANANFIASTYFIPCSSGEVIKFKVDGTINRLRIGYGNTYAQFTTNEAEWTVPSGITQFRFDIGNPITVANAPKVSVTKANMPTLLELGYGMGINTDVCNSLEWDSQSEAIVYKKNVAEVDLNTLTWTKGGAGYWYATFTNAKKYANSVVGNLLSEKYTADSGSNVYDCVSDKTIARPNADALWVVDNSLATTSNPNGKLQYELATPQIYDVTDLLQSDNIVEVEKGGTISFIDSSGVAKAVPYEVTLLGTSDATVKLNAILKGNEKEDADNSIVGDAWTSSKTYAVGEYCISADKLWKCKVQHTNVIPSEGTYWTNVSVTDEIEKLNRDNIFKTIEKFTLNNSSKTLTLDNISTYKLLSYDYYAHSIETIISVGYNGRTVVSPMIEDSYFTYTTGTNSLTITCNVNSTFVLQKLTI